MYTYVPLVSVCYFLCIDTFCIDMYEYIRIKGSHKHSSPVPLSIPTLPSPFPSHTSAPISPIPYSLTNKSLQCQVTPGTSCSVSVHSVLQWTGYRRLKVLLLLQDHRHVRRSVVRRCSQYPSKFTSVSTGPAITMKKKVMEWVTSTTGANRPTVTVVQWMTVSWLCHARCRVTGVVNLCMTHWRRWINGWSP